MDKDYSQILNSFASNHKGSNNANVLPPMTFNCFGDTAVNPNTSALTALLLLCLSNSNIISVDIRPLKYLDTLLAN